MHFDHLRLRLHKELSLIEEKYLGFSFRQWITLIITALITLPMYFFFLPALGSELTSWIVMLAGAPILLVGFVRIQQMSFLQFLACVLRHWFLFSEPLKPPGKEKEERTSSLRQKSAKTKQNKNTTPGKRAGKKMSRKAKKGQNALSFSFLKRTRKARIRSAKAKKEPAIYPNYSYDPFHVQKAQASAARKPDFSYLERFQSGENLNPTPDPRQTQIRQNFIPPSIEAVRAQPLPPAPMPESDKIEPVPSEIVSDLPKSDQSRMDDILQSDQKQEPDKKTKPESPSKSQINQDKTSDIEPVEAAQRKPDQPTSSQESTSNKANRDSPERIRSRVKKPHTSQMLPLHKPVKSPAKKEPERKKKEEEIINKKNLPSDITITKELTTGTKNRHAESELLQQLARKQTKKRRNAYTKE